MIAARQRHEPTPRHPGGQRAPGLERHPHVVARMQDQRGNRHTIHEVRHIDLEERTLELHRVLRRGGNALQLVEPVELRLVGVGHEQLGEDLTIGCCVSAPAHTGERHQGLLLLQSVGIDAALRPSAAVGAVEDQVGDALRMLDGVGDRHGAALGDPEECESVQPRSLHHGLEVPHPRVDGELVDVPVGEAAPALVVSDERVVAGELSQPVAPHRALQVEIEVAEPVRRLHERRALAHAGPGDTDAVRRLAEPVLLAHQRVARLPGAEVGHAASPGHEHRDALSIRLILVAKPLHELPLLQTDYQPQARRPDRDQDVRRQVVREECG